jgi:signal transduction histidine kinase
VSKGNLDQRVKVRSADELGELARVFNEMTDKLRNAMDSRKQMTADIAHELRTPISVILGHAEGIHDGVLPSNQETIEIIREESIRLNHLVDDLRTLSLTDSGELRLDRVPFAPTILLTEVRDLFQYQTSAKGITFEMDMEDRLADISIDKNRLVQVFSNLMDNAIRSTPSGGTICLSGKMVDDDVVMGVHDTGSGIPEGDLDKIFDRLYRTDQARIRDKGGSGLGLTIARSIVEQHGGSIWAESETNKGASIYIRLPMYISTKEE